MRRPFAFAFLLCSLSSVHGRDEINGFITDIISMLQLTSPTIIYHGHVPEICETRQWMLCLDHNNDPSELTEHVTMLFKQRKQDGVLFVGTGADKRFLPTLASQEPSMFRSQCPIVMPLKLSHKIDLKLDSSRKKLP